MQIALTVSRKIPSHHNIVFFLNFPKFSIFQKCVGKFSKMGTTAQDLVHFTKDFFTSTVATIIEEFSNDTKNVKIVSEAETPANYKPHLRLYDIVIPSFGAVIILLNLAVVISSGLILKKGQQPRSTYMFLGNIALADLVTGISVVLGQVFPKAYRDHYVCAVQLGMIVSSTLTSIYSVGLIAIDRYLFILHGIKYQMWVYPVRVRIFIAMSWLIGGIIGYLPLLGWYGDTDNGRVCWFIILAPKELILLTVLVGMIPILVVIVLYSIILYSALRKIIQLQEADEAKSSNAVEGNENSLRIFRGKAADEGESGQPKKTSRAPSKWKAIKVVMFTTGSFIITWAPYFIASLMYGYCYDKQSPRCNTLRILIASPLAILGFCNSLINPIIYAWWHKGFRTFIKKRWAALTSQRKGRQDFTTSTSKNTSSSAKTSNGSKTVSTAATSSSQSEEPSDKFTQL